MSPKVYKVNLGDFKNWYKKLFIITLLGLIDRSDRNFLSLPSDSIGDVLQFSSKFIESQAADDDENLKPQMLTQAKLNDWERYGFD